MIQRNRIKTSIAYRMIGISDPNDGPTKKKMPHRRDAMSSRIQREFF